MSIQIKSLLTTMGAALVLALGVPIATAIGHSAAPAGGLEFTSSPAESTAAAKLREDMRKLWTDHVIWTREYIVAAIDGTPDVNAAATRLMKNQDDIGAAVSTFYGKAAGDALTVLLKEHISIAVDVVAAAKVNDQGTYRAADSRWQKNGRDIAKFLSNANPYWPEAVLVDMMNMHLTTTTKEVVARLNKNWDADVAAFDEVYLHILRMSDALAEGIVKQFPNRF